MEAVSEHGRVQNSPIRAHIHFQNVFSVVQHTHTRFWEKIDTDAASIARLLDTNNPTR